MLHFLNQQTTNRAKLLLYGEPQNHPEQEVLIKPKKFTSKKTCQKFEQDYPVFLVSLAASIRCGLDPLSAFLSCEELFSKKSPMHQEILKSKELLNQGISETVVINSFAQDIKHPDIALFRQAFLLARKEGASLSACLQRIAKVVRTRQSFRRKMRAAVAMQKLSSIGIIFAVLALLIIQLFAAKDTFLSAFSNPLGLKLMILSGSLMSAGIVWMFRVCRIKTSGEK